MVNLIDCADFTMRGTIQNKKMYISKNGNKIFNGICYQFRGEQFKPQSYSFKIKGYNAMAEKLNDLLNNTVYDFMGKIVEEQYEQSGRFVSEIVFVVKSVYDGNGTYTGFCDELESEKDAKK